MSCNKIQPASITPELAAGSVASPYFVEVNINQKLCYPTCADTPPVFMPQFSVKSVTNVGTSQYVVTVHVEGIISYVPCHGGCNCTKQQPLSQDFTVPLFAAAVPTAVTAVAGTTTNRVITRGCESCGKTFISETPLTITVA